MNNIKRIFHPVGQGAFYSEHFEDNNYSFNIVYDCGVLKAITHGEKVVSQAFTKDDEIDILFISHLDYDHISLVKKLKDTVKRIKRVILPLVVDKNYILSFYKAINNGSMYNDVIKLIRNPEEYFGESTKITFVNPVEEGQPIHESYEPTNVERIGNRINSGTAIRFNHPDWIFIPFNHKFKERRNRLEDKLNKAGLSTADIDDSNVALGNLTDEKKRKILKKIYDKVDGNINENSMFLYSGPSANTTNNGFSYRLVCSCYRDCCSDCFHNCHNYRHIQFIIEDRPACIYCGDGDLNKVDILREIRALKKNVGTFQIPHHGSIKSFNKDKIKGNCICPISVGNNNYGHPSSRVIADILGEDSVPIIVSDDKFSSYIQIIRSKQSHKDRLY